MSATLWTLRLTVGPKAVGGADTSRRRARQPGSTAMPPGRGAPPSQRLVSRTWAPTTHRVRHPHLRHWTRVPVSDQVVPRRPNLLTDLPGLPSPRPDPPGHDPSRHFGSNFGSPCDPIGVRHPGTSKPPTAFPLVGGPSSVSTQSAPEGIRTPNLLIRSNSIDPTPTEAARPQTKPDCTFAQVTGVKTYSVGPSRSVTELRSAGFWVTFWVTSAGAGETRGGGVGWR